MNYKALHYWYVLVCYQCFLAFKLFDYEDSLSFNLSDYTDTYLIQIRSKKIHEMQNLHFIERAW